MPSPLLSIKEYIQTHSTDEVKQQVPLWLQQLKQQHISSMALQALLRHFSLNQETSHTTDTTGFIDPNSIIPVDEKELNQLRQQVAGLKSEIGKKECAIKQLKKHRGILLVMLGIMTLVAVLGFVL